MTVLSLAFRSLFALAALLSCAAGALVVASPFIADRGPETGVFLGIHLFVGGAFVALGLVLTGIMVEVAGIARIAVAEDGKTVGLLRTRVLRLLALLAFSGLSLCAMLALIVWAILSRIDEGFAVFG